jgi:hypothetical protein
MMYSNESRHMGGYFTQLETNFHFEITTFGWRIILDGTLNVKRGHD